MRMRQSTQDWAAERDRAWRRRCYLQRLTRHVRELDRARRDGPSAEQAWRRLMEDIARLHEVFPGA